MPISTVSQLQHPPFGSLQCGTLPGLRLWQKLSHCASVQQPGPMKQAGGLQSGKRDAAADEEASAVVTRATAASNNPILFFI